jgi:hypothetical protein
VLADPAFYRTPPEEARKARDRFDAIPAELEAAFARWAELDAEAGAATL